MGFHKFLATSKAQTLIFFALLVINCTAEETTTETPVTPCVPGDVVPVTDVMPWWDDAMYSCNKCTCNERSAWVCEDFTCIEGARIEKMGSFGGSEYLFVRQGRRWNDARKLCQDNGGDMVVINSDAEWTFLVNKLLARGETDFNDVVFLGAKRYPDFENEGQTGPWEWLDGSILAKSDPRFSSRVNPDEPYIACLGWCAFCNDPNGNSLRSFGCNSRFRTICEKPATA